MNFTQLLNQTESTTEVSTIVFFRAVLQQNSNQFASWNHYFLISTVKLIWNNLYCIKF